MAGKPYEQWYGGDWAKDAEVGAMSAEGRGVWRELLELMYQKNTYEVTGTIDGLARQCRLFPDETARGIREIERCKAGNVQWHEDGSVNVVCRRKKREYAGREVDAERKRMERSASSPVDVHDLSSDCPSPVQAPSRVIARADVDVDVKEVIVEVEGSGKETRARFFSSADLEAIYRVYPRKVGKRAALDEIRHALGRIRDGKTDTTPPPDAIVSWLESRVTEYAASPAGNRGRFTPVPSTWFHQDRFDDDPSEWLRMDDTHTKGRTSGTLSARQYAGLSIREKLERGGFVGPSD